MKRPEKKLRERRKYKRDGITDAKFICTKIWNTKIDVKFGHYYNY